MPCTYDDCGESAREQQKQLDILTRAACSACAVLESLDKLALIPTESRAWWNRHKKADAERAEGERIDKKEKAARNAVLAKLTKRERKLLGLD